LTCGTEFHKKSADERKTREVIGNESGMTGRQVTKYIRLTELIPESNRLNRVIRSNDKLSRMGGDEFVILLCEVESEEQVRKIARRIIESIQKAMIIDNLVLNITISVGFAFYPMDGGDYDSLYQVADERMYSCKQKNKNNVPCFEETN